MLVVIILLLNSRVLNKVIARDISLLGIIFAFLVLNKLINNDYFSAQRLLIQASYVLCSFFVLLQYRNKSIELLIYDLFYAVSILSLHAGLGYILFLLVPFSFTPLFGTLNETFYYLFYISNSNFLDIKRNTGLFWEPGTFQLIANIYLFYVIKFKGSAVKHIIAAILVLSSLSTTGLILLFINFSY